MKFSKGSTDKVRKIVKKWIDDNLFKYKSKINYGLPEFDDRMLLWRTTININNTDMTTIGEIKVDKNIKEVVDFTNIDIMVERLERNAYLSTEIENPTKRGGIFYPTPIPNKIILGDCINVLEEFPPNTAQLIVTSPPYYNAKPEYSEYVDYQEYLDFLRKVFIRCHAVLSEGRFFVINVSPVLIKRASRNTSSKRIPIPFDVHQIMNSIGFDFIDDIIWVKPEGAGWNVGRGRRFRADRNPLQYKPVPVTEYVLVYRKRTNKLIDWNIRNHYNQELVADSKILGDYDVTNVWHISPSTNKKHPAVFPEELVRRIIRYYSFKNDMVLDPFGGSGTVGKVAYEMDRRFLLIDKEPDYYQLMKDSISKIISSKVRVDYCVFNDVEEEYD